MSAPPSPRWRLSAHEAPPYRLVNEGGQAPFLLVCDHASPRVPLALDDLGLEQHLLGLHIAYDIGIEALTRALCTRLDACAVLSSYSRLVMDMNRGLSFADSIPELSDGHPVPGNLGLDPDERQHRTALLFRPYHEAIAAAMAGLAARGRRPALVSMHSFTPHMGGLMRPWQVSVMSRHDRRIAAPLIAALRERQVVVGDNEPYTGFDPRGYTVEAHAERHGHAGVLIEVRQDLITDEAGIAEWCALLTETLGAVLRDESLYRPESIDGLR